VILAESHGRISVPARGARRCVASHQ
jgi:hypothetical protein